MENYAIFILQKELETIKKMLDSDVITDMRFSDEIQEDKKKVKQLQRSILILEKINDENYSRTETRKEIAKKETREMET